MSSQPYYNASGQHGIVVVQGTVVQAQGTDIHPDAKYHPQQEVHHGEAQQKRCNDVLFAILFYAHLGVITWTTAAYTPTMMSDVAGSVQDAYQNRMMLEQDGSAASPWSAAQVSVLSSVLSSVVDMSYGRRLQEEDDGGDEQVQYDMAAVWLILGVSAVAGFIISALFLSVMMRFAESLIKFALWFNIITPLFMAILALLAGAIPFALMCFVAFAFTAYYAYVVWGRIPFAAANMRTAVTAVQANFGLTFFAFNSLILGFFWTLWWAVAMSSTIYVTNGCSAQGCESDPSGLVVFGFLVSYFWTAQVIKNTVHTTVAGTVGTWWFHPAEASSCCSKAVCDSFFRTVTYSFGSICLGSLIVAIIQAVKEMAHSAREQGDSALMCCAECILGCIENLVEYFNQWAYVYVALYGYSFIEAGKNVMTLFRERGWTSIITDMLVDGVLAMVSLAVGAITGVVAAIVASSSGLSLGGAEGPSAFMYVDTVRVYCVVHAVIS